MVGEFSASCSESKNPAKDYKYLYDAGYAGALNWAYIGGPKGGCSDQLSQTVGGISALKGMNSNGKIRIQL